MARAVDRAYAVLRARIMSGEYAAGDRLREEELAETLRVSRTPVWEALHGGPCRARAPPGRARGVLVARRPGGDLRVADGAGGVRGPAGCPAGDRRADGGVRRARRPDVGARRRPARPGAG